jgi:hypothetical protein
MFRTVFPSITRSSWLHIQQQAHVKQILLPAASAAGSSIIVIHYDARSIIGIYYDGRTNERPIWVPTSILRDVPEDGLEAQTCCRKIKYICDSRRLCSLLVTVCCITMHIHLYTVITTSEKSKKSSEKKCTQSVRIQIGRPTKGWRKKLNEVGTSRSNVCFV